MHHLQTTITKLSSRCGAPKQIIRTVRGKRLPPEEIAKILDRAKQNKRKFLDQYYSKSQSKQLELNRMDQREGVVKALETQTKGRKRMAKQFEAKVTIKQLERWQDDRIAEFHIENTDLMPEFPSLEIYQMITDLHTKDPDYWNPVRIASLFNIHVAEIRGLLWENKLLSEAKLAGEYYDGDVEYLEEEIEELMIQEAEKKLEAKEKGIKYVPPPPPDDSNIAFNKTIFLDEFMDLFGEIDVPRTYVKEPPEFRQSTKVHNPWYFVPQGVKLQDLIRFLRSRHSADYRETPRIPIRKPDPVVPITRLKASGAEPRVKHAHHVPKFLVVDISDCYNLYNRPMLVRDNDNTWRTANYEERRKFNDSRRLIKRPYFEQWVWPDEDSPNNQSTELRVPTSLRVRFVGGEEMHEVLRGGFDVGSFGEHVSEAFERTVEKDEPTELIG